MNKGVVRESNFELMLGENWAEMMIFSYEITKKKITYVFYISAIVIGNLFDYDSSFIV